MVILEQFLIYSAKGLFAIDNRVHVDGFFLVTCIQ